MRRLHLSPAWGYAVLLWLSAADAQAQVVEPILDLIDVGDFAKPADLPAEQPLGGFPVLHRRLARPFAIPPDLLDGLIAEYLGPVYGSFDVPDRSSLRLQGDRLRLRATPFDAKCVREVIRTLREAGARDLDLDLDFLLSDGAAALGLLVGCGEEREDPLAGKEGRSDARVLQSLRIRCRDGGVAAVESGGVKLRASVLGIPGGAEIGLSGTIDVPDGAGGDGSRSAAFRIRVAESLRIPLGGTVLAGAIALPDREPGERFLLILARLRGADRSFHLDLGRRVHAFDVRDLLAPPRDSHGPEMQVQAPGEEEAAEARGFSFGTAEKGPEEMTEAGLIDWMTFVVELDGILCETVMVVGAGTFFTWGVPPVFLSRISDSLDELRASIPRAYVQATAIWLSVDRDFARRIPGMSEGDGALSGAGLAALRQAIAEGASAEIVDGAATGRDRPWPGRASIRRTDGRGADPDASGLNGGSSRGASLSFDWRGDPSANTLSADIARSLSRGAGGASIREGGKVSLNVRNGAAYLLGGTSLPGEEKRGLYVLLRVCWPVRDEAVPGRP
ncbi:MAG: hypothetical protein JXP34_24400 [Planctomycetes bacterium]|nr:hypothetical protein [Planctomycetota bacterium]